jgi:PKD repeat protein
LPFTDSIDIANATVEPGEPQFCVGTQRTVWYSFTPATNTGVRSDTLGSSFSDTLLNVYQAAGPGFGGLNFITCGIFGNAVVFSAQAGRTYYIQAATASSSVGTLRLNLEGIPSPPNDAFANAAVIPALPFTNSVEIVAATTETGEPLALPCGSPSATVWYAFTPAITQSVTATTSGPFTTVVVAYTGSSLDNLSRVGAICFSSPLTFRANAGTTYFLQAGAFGQTGLLQFGLDVAQPPVANFSNSPFDPSIFDTVQFFNHSFDPAGVGIQSQVWDFGDQTTSTNFNPTHRYTVDGDFTVTLTVTTHDGRTAATSGTIQVKTHDVAITRFNTPSSGCSGQTRQISVGVASRRYGENVQVQLSKSGAGGFEIVGTLNQFVEMQQGNNVVPFDFSYTFTNDDVTLGNVTFKAVATILGARDALPGDNEAIGSPTRVQH